VGVGLIRFSQTVPQRSSFQPLPPALLKTSSLSTIDASGEGKNIDIVLDFLARVLSINRLA
jgi:hypothetical protein